MRAPSRVLLLAAGAWAVAACGGGVLSPAESEFDVGHYPAAKQAFAALEFESRSWDDATRAEYALYRGLTHGALGDDARALEWLRQAKALDDAHPGTLSPDGASRLRVALASLELAR